MTKNLYVILIALLGLSAAAIIADSIIRFQIGNEIFALKSFVEWFLMLQITGVIGSILLLKYYYYRGYKIAFFTAIINVIANLSVAAVFLLSSNFITLLFAGLRSYYIPLLLFSLGTLFLYALSLTFSNIRKRFWLKLAGVCAIGICLALIAAVIGQMNPNNVTIKLSGKIVQWIPITGGLFNVLFIINFLEEISTLNAESTIIPRKKTVENIFGFLAIVAFAIIIVSGTSLVHQIVYQSY